MSGNIGRVWTLKVSKSLSCSRPFSARVGPYSFPHLFIYMIDLPPLVITLFTFISEVFFTLGIQTNQPNLKKIEKERGDNGGFLFVSLSLSIFLSLQFNGFLNWKPQPILLYFLFNSSRVFMCRKKSTSSADGKAMWTGGTNQLSEATMVACLLLLLYWVSAKKFSSPTIWSFFLKVTTWFMFFNSQENILSGCGCVCLFVWKRYSLYWHIYIYIYICIYIAKRKKKKKSFGFACSGGDIGEPGIFSKRKQLGTVSIRVHALLSF